MNDEDLRDDYQSMERQAKEDYWRRVSEQEIRDKEDKMHKKGEL